MKNIIDKVIEAGAEEAELYYLNDIKEEITFENNKLKTVNNSQNSGVGVRAVKDGKMGFVTSSNLDDINKLAKNAIEVTTFSPKMEFGFACKAEMPHINLSSKKIWDIPMDNFIKDGERVIDKVKKYDDSILVNVTFNKEKRETRIINTNGLDAEYEKDNFNVFVQGNLIEGSSFINCAVSEKNKSGNYNIEEMAERIIKDISIGRKNCDFEAGSKSVILTPTVLTQVLLTLQRGVNGNLVEKGISPLCGKIGEKIFDEEISIADDGTMEEGEGSMAFDDEGTPAQKTVIVENGVLKSYLHSIKTATKLGYNPTGNGLKNEKLFLTKKYDIMPHPDITNWIMSPGNVKYEDMISEIKDGVIIDDIMGIFMNNLENGDFAGNIGMGYVIKNGKIIGRLKDAAINANIYDIFLNNIVALSDKLYRASLFSCIGTHMYPYIMLKDINISSK